MVGKSSNDARIMQCAMSFMITLFAGEIWLPRKTIDGDRFVINPPAEMPMGDI
jgi:hypothetical protein